MVVTYTLAQAHVDHEQSMNTRPTIKGKRNGRKGEEVNDSLRTFETTSSQSDQIIKTKEWRNFNGIKEW